MTATIQTDGLYGGYYVNYGNATRSRRSFKTIAGAIKHAVAKGHKVDMDDLPNPNATSVAGEVIIDRTCTEAFNGKVESVLSLYVGKCLIRGPISDFNTVLKRMGYRPVRITANRITGNGTPLVIDADTPMCCDPGTETYHSM